MWGFPQSERRVSRTWARLGQFPPGGLNRGAKTCASDKSSWVGPRSLLEQRRQVKVRVVFSPRELGAQRLVKAQLHRKRGVWTGCCLGRRLSFQVVQLWGREGRGCKMKWELTPLSPSRNSLQGPQPNCLKGELIWLQLPPWLFPWRQFKPQSGHLQKHQRQQTPSMHNLLL